MGERVALGEGRRGRDGGVGGDRWREEGGLKCGGGVWWVGVGGCHAAVYRGVLPPPGGSKGRGEGTYAQEEDTPPGAECVLK